MCRKQLTKFQAKTFVEAIDNEYRVHWIVDNLPSSTVRTKLEMDEATEKGGGRYENAKRGVQNKEEGNLKKMEGETSIQEYYSSIFCCALLSPASVIALTLFHCI